MRLCNDKSEYYIIIRFNFALPFIALIFLFGTGLPPPSSKTKDKTHSVQRQINLLSIALQSTSNTLQNIALDNVIRGRGRKDTRRLQ